MSFRASTEANDAQLAPTRRWTRPLNSAAARRLRVSVDPPGCGSGAWDSCAAGAMLSPWLRRTKTLPVFWRCSCRTAKRHFQIPMFVLPPRRRFRKADQPHEPMCGACLRWEASFHFLPCRVMASPGDSVHALQQKRTGRRKILSSLVGDSFRGLICVLFLHKTYSFFAAAADEALTQVLSRFCSKLRKLKGIVRLQSSNSALS